MWVSKRKGGVRRQVDNPCPQLFLKFDGGSRSWETLHFIKDWERSQDPFNQHFQWILIQVSKV